METLWSLFQQQRRQQPADKTVIRWVDSRLNMTPITWKTLCEEIDLRALSCARLVVQKETVYFCFSIIHRKSGTFFGERSNAARFLASCFPILARMLWLRV